MLKKLILSIISIALLINLTVFADGKEEIVFTTAYSGFSTDGSWQNSSSLIGYNGSFILNVEADKNTAARWDVVIDSGLYRVYVWRCLKDTGCNEVKTEVTCASGTTEGEYSMAYGVTGWHDLGLYDISDGKASIKVSGESGTLMVSAIKLVREDSSLRHLQGVAFGRLKKILLK